ncbi:GH3 auxin-responsive promoter family protein [Microvirga sp. STR05]|uniref:GH3 auxin-responsive promoter family protein n=1 Tax=Hymenobacter duratus TaxID=2771356 RepID=A0ABR8JGP0_9BACT|nr:GH3 auxin-responsive promoter family protein [Hymenobacter duratus]MBD2714753.1 GH3 auxin-responsive promoter family protein [Hymenobacter duratus]MBR7949658.1 GH3 auxin-responsive promoter family protein [Microvirga sp. STR05]
MGLKSVLSRPLAAYIARQYARWQHDPIGTQQQVLQELLKQGARTAFGRDHSLAGARTAQDLARLVPVRDYEALSPYFNRVKAGEADVLWPGKPLYLAKTSGTTSGAKYIPITQDSIPNHINGARDALLHYVHRTGNSRFLDGKLIFLSGSPELETVAGIHTGRLSGIANHHVPAYLRRNQLPSYQTNIIEDWETKLDRIVEETLHQPMTLISGIPPWVQMYFDRIVARAGRPVGEVFPQFDLFVYGGVNFEPYRKKLFETIGRPVDSVELFPASEGFLAFQDEPGNPGMLLLLNAGIFYEFVPAERFFEENPPRLTLAEVELDQQYALVLTSNAGLWAYSIGDTVRFTQKYPFRVVVTGRIKHFLSAFGEHVIGEEVEQTLREAMRQHPEVEVVEFTVAPRVSDDPAVPSRHEWLVEFAQPPHDLAAFAAALDTGLRQRNTYYDDLLAGNILAPLQLTPLSAGAFQRYMKSQGKLGGQNKVPRLSNDRKLAEGLLTVNLV